MANWQVISLDTVTPQLRAPGTGDGYSFNSGATQLGVWTTTGLGVGTASPVAKFAVQDAAAPKIALQVGATERAFLEYTQSTFVTRLDSDGPLSLASNNTEAVYLTSFQDVGVGTQTPDDKFSVAGNIGAAQTGNAGFKFYSAAPGSNALEWFLYNSTSSSNALQLSYYNSGVFGGTVLTANKSGNIGIGTTSPVSDGLTIGNDASGSATVKIAFSTTTTERASLQMSGGSGEMRMTAGYAGYGGFATFYTAGSERMRLDSSGNLGLGVTPSAWASGRKAFQFNNVGALWQQSNGYINLAYNTYEDGANTFKYILTDGAARFGVINGAFAWYNAPSGTAGNAITFTQAMTLGSDGNLALGTTNSNISGQSSNVRVLTVQGPVTWGGVEVATSTSDGDGNLLGFYGFTYPTNSANYKMPAYIGAWSEGATANQRGANLRFFTQANATAGATERARITSGGDLLVGTTNSSDTAGEGIKMFPTTGGVDAGKMVFVGNTASSSIYPFMVRSSSANAWQCYIDYAGNIYAQNTSITSLSDVRLKENVRDLDSGLNAVMALKPRKFDWKEGKGQDKKDVRGFIAQEFEQVFPDLVNEWIDPAPDGEEPYKAVRQDLIPVLVKAIQELKAELDATKAEVAALKGA